MSPPWLKDYHPSPESLIEMKNLEQCIQNCINQLSDEYKLIVLMVDIEGLNYKEASLSFHKPMGTIKSRLSRARLKLRGCLQSYWELLPDDFRLIMENQKR